MFYGLDLDPDLIWIKKKQCCGTGTGTGTVGTVTF